MENKVVTGLQTIVTELSQQADGHLIQSRIFAAQGLNKLAENYKEHAAEERDYVVKCIDRLIDLGCEVKLEAKKCAPICKDAVEYLKHDLQVSKDGLAWLKEIVCAAQDDLTTFDLLKAYYQDEEGDMYWAEQQLALIELIGKQNWLAKQI
jgi:bacterioferritin